MNVALRTEDWSHDLEILLEAIRSNSSQMSTYHKDRYLKFKSYLVWFRLPTIFIASITIFTSEGLTPYVQQTYVNLINAMLAIVTGLINSTELFLGIQRTSEADLEASRDFYILAIDIYKMLAIEPAHRQVSGRVFVDEVYSRYTALIEQNGSADNSQLQDKMVPINALHDMESPPVRRVSTFTNNSIAAFFRPNLSTREPTFP